MSRLRVLALLVPFLLLTAGCHRRPEASQNWTLQLKTVPEVPTSGQNTTFVLRLTGANGQPVTGASAQVSLQMTFMDMGTNVVPLRESSPGVYSGAGQFSMPGDWDCKVRVKTPQRQQSQVFHYKIG